MSRDFDSTKICNSPNAVRCLERLLALSRDSALQAALLKNALLMYEDRFHPDKIREALVESCQELLPDWKNSK